MPRMAAATAAASGSKVLILADIDGPSTDALAGSLTNAGFQVTVRPGPEYMWDATDPDPSGFQTIVHLNGATYFAPLSDPAQAALTAFVQAGGGYVGGQLTGLEYASGWLTGMSDLVLQDFGVTELAQDCFSCEVDYNTVSAQASHPVLAGLPASFKVSADYHNAGSLLWGSTVLATVNSGEPAVTVRELGAGRVVNFSFAPNYMTPDDVSLFDPEVQRLYINAVRWAGRAGPPPKLPATLTVGTAFTYDGTIKQATVTTTPAGLSGVSVTYTLNGSAVAEPIDAGVYQVLATLDNPTYEALPATGTLTIDPALPAIQWASPAPITAGTALGPIQLNAAASGVGGISLTGTFAYLPAMGAVLTAGTNLPLSVEFSPNSGNYTHAIKTVTITVTPVVVPPPPTGLTFKGFFLPVRNMPVVNRVKAGHAIPVRFTVTGSSELPVMSSASVQCNTAMSERSLNETVNASASRLIAAGGSYKYIWKTSPAWANSCRKLVVTLSDGSTHEARFHFSKKAEGHGRRDYGRDNHDGEHHDGQQDHDHQSQSGNDRHESQQGSNRR